MVKKQPEKFINSTRCQDCQAFDKKRKPKFDLNILNFTKLLHAWQTNSNLM